jgi:hydroxyacylglutathione hydrolase
MVFGMSRHDRLQLEIRTSGIWQTNSVVLSAAGQVLIVDPAFFPRELDDLAALARGRGEDVTVVFTHGHWDHVAGWRHFPGARCLGSAALAQAVAQGQPAARRNLDELRDFEERWYVARTAPPAWPGELRGLGDDELVTLGDREIRALALAGHSPDGLALWLADEGLLLPGDHLSSCEIPFVDDLVAYRATLARLRSLLPQVRRVVPGHGPALDRATATSILDADLGYLDALANCAERGDREGALALPLPRAAQVPGMREWHTKNCVAAGLAVV